MTPKYESAIPAGNIMEMQGLARRWLRQLGHPSEEIDAMSKRVMASQSYKDACNVIREYFPITYDNED